jgi:hypothetical protein
MRKHYTLAEIAELAHCVAWYMAIHRVNDLFDIEPSDAVLAELRATVYADPADAAG